MANRDNPMGFEPVMMLDGSQIPVMDFPVDASNATAIFQGDLVKAEADGNVAPAAANDGDPVLGVVVAVKDSDGNSAGHPNGTLSTKYLPATTAGIVTVALALPNAVFRVQSDSGTNVAETARFASANHAAGAGDTTTARSKHELDSSDIGTGAQLKIIDKVDEPGNAWGDEHVDLLVVIAESYWYDSTAGV